MWAFTVAAIIFFVGWLYYSLGVSARADGFLLLGLGFAAIGYALKKP